MGRGDPCGNGQSDTRTSGVGAKSLYQGEKNVQQWEIIALKHVTGYGGSRFGTTGEKG